MSAEQSRHEESLVPPEEAGQAPPYPRMTVWPKRLGILLIVLAAIGLLSSPMALSVTTQENVIRLMMPQDMTPNPQALRQVATWKVGLALLAILVDLPMLAGGIGLLRRRGWGVRWAAIWALLGVAFALVIAAVDIMVSRAIAAAAEQTVNLLPGQMLLSLVFNLLLPSFVLLWLARPAIREEVADWR